MSVKTWQLFKDANQKVTVRKMLRRFSFLGREKEFFFFKESRALGQNLKDKDFFLSYAATLNLALAGIACFCIASLPKRILKAQD